MSRAYYFVFLFKTFKNDKIKILLGIILITHTVLVLLCDQEPFYNEA